MIDLSTGSKLFLQPFYLYYTAPPPPPPLPTNTEDVSEPKGKMNVKRINWEKIDAQKVGNTVWGQVILFLVLTEH